jgi:drug/metabolite transporter (DMT)-like permease
MRPCMHTLNRQQLITLIVLTLVWGTNWPILKLGIEHYPPLAFRTWSMVLGLPVLALVLWVLKVPFAVDRKHWPELIVLTVLNMLAWHALMILGLPYVSSGRAAILGYTMPIFSALFGAWLYQQRLGWRGMLGVGAAALGVALLLAHELQAMSRRPLGVLLILSSAAIWALGTQRLRRTRIDSPTLTIAFWMTLITTACMAALTLTFEPGHRHWGWPPAAAWFPIIYNAIGVFVFAQAAWFYLARTLPPLASTLSVMMIPVLGVLSGAWWLNEKLFWQDGAAVVLIMLAIAAVLWPQAAPKPDAGPKP